MANVKRVWKHPEARAAFNMLLLIMLLVSAWGVVIALTLGGIYWWAVLFGLVGWIVVLGLAEFAGAYDEELREDDETHHGHLPLDS